MAHYKKDIIIHGVNVTPCENYIYWGGSCRCKSKLYKRFGSDDALCKDFKDCYYKQLQRLKEEYKKLKEREEECDYLLQALDKIEGIIKTKIKLNKKVTNVEEVILNIINEVKE